MAISPPGAVELCRTGIVNRIICAPAKLSRLNCIYTFIHDDEVCVCVGAGGGGGGGGGGDRFTATRFTISHFNYPFS